MRHFCWLILFLVVSVNAQEPFIFDNQATEDRFETLAFELRCPVCQNQNLADSDAPLAHDLRQQIYDMIMDGKTDEQIKQFMVERYGDFVLYRPPVQANTWLLWLAPLIMLIIGGWVLFANVRKRAALQDSTEEFKAENNNE